MNAPNATKQSGLFGIKHSNRDVDKHFGKNCFNSSFPTSIACYMFENHIPAVYNQLKDNNGKLEVDSSEIYINDLFRSEDWALSMLDFHFESRFEPYQKYSLDQIDSIDLVVKVVGGTFLMPLEIKLTVLPTSGTANFDENLWGCELVVRSATTSYCALGMFDAINSETSAIREIFEDTCTNVESWTNNFEMAHKTPNLILCINEFERKYLINQKPLVMQTVWKTQGQSPILADNAFDIIVWSDYAFSRLFLDMPEKNNNEMSRPMRASAKLARCLWELSKSGKIRLDDIYRQMAFDTQTDKEFAISGQIWRNYVRSDRVVKPILHKDVLNEIIQPGYIERLRPERRFDQTLYYTVRGNNKTP